MDQLRKDFGRKIRELRKVKGLTQEDLAAKADMEYSYLGAIERGEKNPTLDYIGKIAIGLGVEVYQLFFFTTEGLKKEKELTEEKIEDILNLCDNETKKASLSVIKTMWQLRSTKEKS